MFGLLRQYRRKIMDIISIEQIVALAENQKRDAEKLSRHERIRHTRH